MFRNRRRVVRGQCAAADMILQAACQVPVVQQIAGKDRHGADALGQGRHIGRVLLQTHGHVPYRHFGNVPGDCPVDARARYAEQRRVAVCTDFEAS